MFYTIDPGAGLLTCYRFRRSAPRGALLTDKDIRQGLDGVTRIEFRDCTFAHASAGLCSALKRLARERVAIYGDFTQESNNYIEIKREDES